MLLPTVSSIAYFLALKIKPNDPMPTRERDVLLKLLNAYEKQY